MISCEIWFAFYKEMVLKLKQNHWLLHINRSPEIANISDQSADDFNRIHHSNEYTFKLLYYPFIFQKQAYH